MTTLLAGNVKDYAGRQPVIHPTNKRLVVFTDGANHFICEEPVRIERFADQLVIRPASEGEINHHRTEVNKEKVGIQFL